MGVSHACWVVEAELLEIREAGILPMCIVTGTAADGKAIANSAVEFIIKLPADYSVTNNQLQATTNNKITNTGSEAYLGFDEGNYNMVVTCKVKTGTTDSTASFTKPFTVARVPKGQVEENTSN